jgi:putative thymidine phosphorylase
MIFSAVHIRLSTGWPYVAIISAEDARRLGVHPFDRVNIRFKSKVFHTILDISDTQFPVKPGEIGLFNELYNAMGSVEGCEVSVTPASKPDSIRYIHKKMNGFQLTKEEVFEIVKDITDRKLSNIEMTYFVTAAYINEFTWNEVVWLTEAMIKTGRQLRFNGSTVVDKHCIGGVPGNRTTMLIVPIIAANGLMIPKTSSRSITSPAGTADTMEVLADVNLGFEGMKEVTISCGGCIAWGGEVDLAPADDQIIKIEHPMSIDAEGQLLASVIAKKASVHAKHLLIDIPFGLYAKCKTPSSAKALGEKFLKLGNYFGLDTHIVITDGSQPIGNGIGPALEAIDVMKVLSNASDAPADLKAKSIFLAGKILEMAGKAKQGEGLELARKTIDYGVALKKMDQIIDAQGRRVGHYTDIQIGKHTFEHSAKRRGIVGAINTSAIASIAKAAGAPLDKGAGIRVHKHCGDKVSKGETLFTIYAESSCKLAQAEEILKQAEPYSY